MKQDLVFLFMIFVVALSNDKGQTKYEREFRMSEKKVPQKAREFVHSMDFESKVKWYFEENLQGNSIEAKLKQQGQQYSVEFDTLGTLQDVEVEIIRITL